VSQNDSRVHPAALTMPMPVIATLARACIDFLPRRVRRWWSSKFPMPNERAENMPFPTLDEVVDQLREIAEDDTIGPDSVITSLEIDSLDLMEWVFEIEGQAEARIDDSLYSKKSLESTTVGDFYERVKSALS
jgi:acyl carrier protein